MSAGDTIEASLVTTSIEKNPDIMGSNESSPEKRKLFLSQELKSTNDEEDSATESLTPIEDTHEDILYRSDGSDSGFSIDIPQTSTDPSYSPSKSQIDQILRKPNLKRKLEETPCDGEASAAKKKRRILFDSVTVFYFPRAQGFTCVPSQGGSTLGMASHHTHVRKFTVAEHANEQRRLHKQVLLQLRSEGGTGAPCVTKGASSSDDSESEEELSDTSETELDLESYNFLQPVPTRQRRMLLRAAGVRKIESVEKDECRDIRTSREFCGCGCKGYCDPDTCSCSQAGIKCQVDRLNFPCGCSREYCGNSSGRIEFNPVRVRTHFIHTLMRLELEKKQNADEEEELRVQAKQQKRWSAETAVVCEFQNSNSELLSKEDIEPSSSYSNVSVREDSLDLYTFRDDYYHDDVSGEMPSTLRGQFSESRFAELDFGTNETNYTAQSQHYRHTNHSNFNEFTGTVFNSYVSAYQNDFESPELYNNRLNPVYTDKDDTKERRYTSLVSVGSNGKLESLSDILQGRYSFNFDGNSQVESVSCSDVGQTRRNFESSSTSDEGDENFGEIIKKSIVETVSA